MPEPKTVDQVAPGGVVDLSSAPAAIDDATFDSLFPADGTSQAPTRTEPQTQTQQQVTQPQTVQPATTQEPTQPFLKGDKSVYNTPEAAREGINQKDALIEQLRQRYALTTGIDPITGQPVQGTQVQIQQPTDYYNNAEQYIADLYKAAKEGGPQAYRDIQAKFILDTLKPLAPTLERAAREQALETLQKEVPNAKEVMGTPAYQRALDTNLELKNAIAAAEQDYRFHSRLPGLYKLAVLASQGMQLPELLQQRTQVQTQTNQPVRTTVQPTTAAPPTQTVKPNLGTIEGIRAVIANAEGRGAKLDF